MCPCTWAGARTNIYATCCLPCAYGYVQRVIDPTAECACLPFFAAHMLANSNEQGLFGDIKRAGGSAAEVVLVVKQRERFAAKMGVQLSENECLVDTCCMPCAVGQEMRLIEERSRGGVRPARLAVKQPPCAQRMVI